MCYLLETQLLHLFLHLGFRIILGGYLIIPLIGETPQDILLGETTIEAEECVIGELVIIQLELHRCFLQLVLLEYL